MRREVAVLIVVMLVPAVAGESYSTVVYDDDLEEHFQVDGWIQSSSTNEISISARYKAELDHKYYESSSVDSFTFMLMDGNTTVAETTEGGFSLSSGESRTSYLSFSSNRSPDRIDTVRIEVIHRGTTDTGRTDTRYVNGSFPYQPTELDPRVLDVETSSSSVTETENVSLTVETRGISDLDINGSEMKYLGEDRFRTSVRASRLENGTNTALLETGRNATFTEKFNLTIRPVESKDTPDQNSGRKESKDEKNDNSTNSSSSILEDENAKSFPGVFIDPLVSWISSYF